MSRRTAAEDREARRAYRYIHAAARLRFRYGVEITREEYDELCERFRTGYVAGARENAFGDREGWVEIRGVWACAHYKRREGVIATFMPAPPPKPMAAEPPPPPPPAPKPKKAKQPASRAGMAETIVQLQELVRLRGEDVAWFKRRILDAAGLLKSGLAAEAYVLLDQATRLRKTDHPGVVNLSASFPEDLQRRANYLAAHGVPEAWWDQAPERAQLVARAIRTATGRAIMAQDVEWGWCVFSQTGCGAVLLWTEHGPMDQEGPVMLPGAANG